MVSPVYGVREQDGSGANNPAGIKGAGSKAIECSFPSWASEWSGGGVVAIDGKSLRGTSEGQPHDVPIVTIDAMGTQTKIARAIRDKGADYVLALKGNQSRLHDDVARYFADEALAKTCTTHATAGSGHGRTGERCIRVSGGTGWLKNLHPNWAGLRCLIAVTSVRTHKKSGAASKVTRFYIASLPPDPEHILAAIRAHWSIETTLHWPLDMTSGEDSCRLRKDNAAAANMAVIRKAAFNALKRLPSKLSLKLRRVQASLDPAYRSALISS